MGGVANKTRRFGEEWCRGVLTKKLVLDHWGDALLNMPMKAREIHYKKGVFSDTKHHVDLTPEECKHELGVVSYKGNGKYPLDSTIYVPFHELPDSEDTASKEQMQTICPEGQGWWPVIALQTKDVTPPFEVECRYQPSLQPKVITKKVITKKIFVVCFYQVLQDGRVWGWWLYA